MLIFLALMVLVFLLPTFEVIRPHNAWILLGLFTIGYGIYRTIFIGATIYTPGFVVAGLGLLVWAYLEARIKGEEELNWLGSHFSR